MQPQYSIERTNHGALHCVISCTIVGLQVFKRSVGYSGQYYFPPSIVVKRDQLDCIFAPLLERVQSQECGLSKSFLPVQQLLRLILRCSPHPVDSVRPQTITRESNIGEYNAPRSRLAALGEGMPSKVRAGR